MPRKTKEEHILPLYLVHPTLVSGTGLPRIYSAEYVEMPKTYRYLSKNDDNPVTEWAFRGFEVVPKKKVDEYKGSEYHIWPAKTPEEAEARWRCELMHRLEHAAHITIRIKITLRAFKGVEEK